METLHVKLSSEEAINSKKNILHTEMNLLNLIKKIQNYKQLRNLELRSKTLLKTEIKKLAEEITELKKQLPKAKIQEKQVMIEQGLGKITRGRLELELQEIKEKLEKLGNANSSRGLES